MEQKTIHPKSGLGLRKIGRQYMIVESCEGNENLSNVYSLNRTAAQMWEQINQGGYTPEQLAEWLDGHYGIGKDTARRDVEKQLDEWKAFGLID